MTLLEYRDLGLEETLEVGDQGTDSTSVDLQAPTGNGFYQWQFY